MKEYNAQISKEDKTGTSTYIRTKLTDTEKLINEFFISILESDKRFVTDDNMLAIKIEDLNDHWCVFRKKWETKSA